MNASPSIASGIFGREEISRVRLEVARYAARTDIPENNLRIEQYTEEATRTMIMEFHAKVASKKYAVKTVSYPATWWDAFKKRFYPARWLKRWPVVFEEVTMEASAYYPDIEIPGHAAFVDIAHKARRRTYESR